MMPDGRNRGARGVVNTFPQRIFIRIYSLFKSESLSANII
jgi:hypothetical protein